MNVKLLGIKAITSLHVGAGRGLGHIDLPVAREKATNYPYLPGSALKGVFRDKHEGKANFEAAFGDRKVDGSDETTAGSLVFADARLLALPIRSFFGTFAAVSCPTIIKRLYADLNAFGLKVEAPKIPALKDADVAVTSTSPLSKEGEKKVYLEDVDFNVVDEKVDAFVADLVKKFPSFGESGLNKRFALVADDAFSCLCETGTEINAHIRIDSETGTVKKGALWYQETLPSETFMYSFVFCDKVYGSKVEPEELLKSFCASGDHYLQFGGKASTGLGRCQCRFEEAK